MKLGDSTLAAIISGGFLIIATLVHRVHTAVNSRMTEMLGIMKKLGHAEGVAAEKKHTQDVQD